MVLKLQSGLTRLITIYNVIKVTSDLKHELIVVNKVEGALITNHFKFNVNYNNFILMDD